MRYNLKLEINIGRKTTTFEKAKNLTSKELLIDN